MIYLNRCTFPRDFVSVDEHEPTAADVLASKMPDIMSAC